MNANPKPTLLLIDGHSLAFRAFYALNPDNFKTKDGLVETWGRLAYDQYIQLAAYQHGLGLPESECVNIFVSRDASGGCRSHVWAVDDIRKGKEMFTASLQLWQIVKGYTPVLD